ncbi:glycoside hydrolase family 15 protein [Salinifilum aidingensis]
MASDQPSDPATIDPAPIEHYALLGDLRTAALVSRDGSIDWLCLPRFDSPSCFSRLLGTPDDGHWRIAPTAEVTAVERAYRADTLVLDTDMRTAGGTVRITDCMPPRQGREDGPPCVIRTVTGLRGTVEISMDWVLRFAYADATPWVRRVHATEPVPDEYVLAVAGPHSVVLRGDVLPRARPGQRAHELALTVREGEQYTWTMQWSEDPDQLPAPPAPRAAVGDTVRFWRDWSERIVYTGPHRQAVRRSLLTLKALTYAPTGGIVAAPTTSLPESFEGDRNWDYRYCWLRDATFVLLALENFGCQQEARQWRQWLLRSVAGDPADLQVAYGVGGERHLLEWQVDWLRGYQGRGPVRVGNDAYRQRQLDVYGEILDALHFARERGLEESEPAWALQRGILRHVEQVWREPDRGLWEVRGPARHFTHSRVLLWVAFDRAVRAVEEDGLSGPVQRWRELRDQLHAEVLEHGWNPDVGAFTQYYGGTELDAATLLLPAVGFLPGADERVRSTVRAVQRRLQRSNGLVDRYDTSGPRSHEVDGLAAEEGSFLACSFWLVDALAAIGERAEATELFDRLVGLSNDLGLYAEEYDEQAGRFTGNYPQAFTHLALVNSAAVLYGGIARGQSDRRTRAAEAAGRT